MCLFCSRKEQTVPGILCTNIKMTARIFHQYLQQSPEITKGCDVQLKIGGNTILYAHKRVLTFYSKVFRDVLMQKGRVKPSKVVIELPHDTYVGMFLFLEALYSGPDYVTPDIAGHVIPLYHRYQCTERLSFLEGDIVYGSCYDFFDTKENILRMLAIARRYYLFLLIEKCLDSYHALCN